MIKNRGRLRKDERRRMSRKRSLPSPRQILNLDRPLGQEKYV